MTVVVVLVSIAVAGFLAWGYRVFVNGARVHDGGIIDATQALTDDELRLSITALNATYGQLMRAGDTHTAARVACDRAMCLSELEQRASGR